VNRQDRVKVLAESLREANRKAEQERADKQQVERIAAAVKVKLAHIHASDDDLVCPSCGYKGPESDFEPDTNEESDGYSTDDETSDTGGDSDSDEELDAAGKKRVVAELLRNRKRRR
jgi:hypothetical protein